MDMAYAADGVNGKAELRDAAAAENKSLPVHRWVPWIAGFSAQFVEDAIDAYLPQRSRGKQLVLDPFSGVGTTLVEAAKSGCHTTGYEINAFAALACEAKLDCIDIEPPRFESAIGSFRGSMTDFESEVDSRFASEGEDGLSSVLDTLRLAGPATAYKSRIPFFSPPVEAKFLFALARTSTVPRGLRPLFQIALGATMVSISNYSYEPSLSSRPGAGKALVANASVGMTVCQRLGEMLDDIQWVQSAFGEKWKASNRIVHADSYMRSNLTASSVSLVVTSPPYMNNYHYVRNTRPQLHWLGLVQGSQELRDYEQDSFGKFWQTVRQSEAVNLDCDLPRLAESIELLRASSPERGVYGGRGWANYVATYFNDCDRFLKLTKRHVKRGGRAIVVVGNSIIQGIEFKVDELLAELAERNRLVAEDIRIVRTKRVGNSIIDSSVRNGSENGHQHKTQLYDAAVVLRA
jgi:hypothetical protein